MAGFGAVGKSSQNLGYLMATADACMVWVQALNPDDNDADYIDMQFGVHGYPE